jgi:xanthine/CO dehydrogenase XdhC/CoxF family maturation factor
VELLVEPFDAAHPPQLLQGPRWDGRASVTVETRLSGRVLLVETVHPRPLVAVYGGADAEPLVRLARSAGFRASIVEAPDVPDGADAAVVMTHRLERDVAVLSALAPTDVAYIGLLGPRSRAAQALRLLGASAPRIRPRLFAPAGLDLAAETPEEIALSILAEIQAVLAGGSAGFLRDGRGAIHRGGQVARRRASTVTSSERSEPPTCAASSASSAERSASAEEGTRASATSRSSP